MFQEHSIHISVKAPVLLFINYFHIYTLASLLKDHVSIISIPLAFCIAAYVVAPSIYLLTTSAKDNLVILGICYKKCF